MNPYVGPHAAEYARQTRDLDLSPLRDRFLARVRERVPDAPPHILDVGCGSGRDARAFLEAGCTVEAMDASPDLARLAEEHTGIPVDVLRVQELDRHRDFHGIWACASLLHVPWAELPDVFRRLERALHPEGALYASFQLGEGERTVGERHFTDLNRARLEDRTPEATGLRVAETWVTPDVRPEREDVQWFNALLERAASG